MTFLEARAEANRAWELLKMASHALATCSEEPHAIESMESELKAAARRYGLACEKISLMERSSPFRRGKGDV